MLWPDVESKWDVFRARVLNQWSKLTESDLQRVAGSRSRLSGRLQDRYGIGGDEAERQIESWLAEA